MFYWRITWLIALIILLLASLSCKYQTNDNPQEPDIEVKYWSLSTGSKIAYVNFPSKDSLHSIPLIFLHGGPGANQVQLADIGRRWYERLAGLGFDVYIYDQIGSGLSARLKDPSEYSVKRHVEDLESIRKLIGKEKIILAGDSWGATLASNYISFYPNNVLKVIFTSPGPIDHAVWNIKSSTPRLAPEFLNWINQKFGEEKYRHYLILDSLLKENISLAYKYAGDREMDKLADDFLNDYIMHATVYDPDIIEESNLKMEGTGWWVMIMTIWDATNKNYSAATGLFDNNIPALILRGDSDYLPDGMAAEYSNIFTNSKFIRVPDCGHLIWLEKPEVYTKEIESFLNNN